MFILIQGGVHDDGDTFVDVLSPVLNTLQEGKDEFYKFVVEHYFEGQDIPRDYRLDSEDGLFVDFSTCIYTESTDSYIHIELKSIKK